MNVAFGVLSVEVIGAFLMLILFIGARRRLSMLEVLPLSFFLGAGFIAYQLLIYDYLGIDFSSKSLIFPSIIMFLGVFLYYGLNPSRWNVLLPTAEEARKRNLLEWLLVAGILIQFLWVLTLVAPFPVHSHDAVANYALKAKIFHSTGGIPGGFFNWSESSVAHPDYPLLLPLLMTWVYAFSGFNDLMVNVIMPVAYASFLMLLYFQIKKIFARPYPLLMIFFLATIPQLADYATIIHADLFFTALITCAFAYLILYIRGLEKNYLVFSSVLFGFSIWAKNEAIVFVVAAVAVFIAFLVRSEPMRRKRIVIDMVIMIAIIAVIAAPWLATKALYSATNSDIDFSKINSGRLLQNIKDIPVLLNLFQQEVFGPKKWNILWIVFFAALVWKRKKLWEREVFYITLFMVLSAAGYLTAYMCTTGENLFFYVNTTISRFMLHFSGVATFLLAYLLYDDICKVESFSCAVKGAGRGV